MLAGSFLDLNDCRAGWRVRSDHPMTRSPDLPISYSSTPANKSVSISTLLGFTQLAR